MDVYHFHNGTGGGVLSVIKNLTRFSANPGIKNHIIYTINREQISSYLPERIPQMTSQQVFYYSNKNNFYYTCRQLSKLLTDENSLVIAHDWLELGMMSNLGLPNPVIHVLHGDLPYYYDLAKMNAQIIDRFICISPTIAAHLIRELPKRGSDISNLKFPVPPVAPKSTTNTELKLIYFVRDLKEERKQFPVIVEIISELFKYLKNFRIAIAGGGFDEENFPVFKNFPENAFYIGEKSNDEILTILPDQDLFLLPSLAEGFPVSLVEAMKAGLVPLVTKWDGAASELVIPGITGFTFAPKAVKEYVECILKLQNDRYLLKQMSSNSIQRANSLFDPEKNTRDFEVVYSEVAQRRKLNKQCRKVYGSRLDQRWMPNIVPTILRSLTRKNTSSNL